MKITINVGTRTDGNIESIIREVGGEELHRELLVLQDIGLCQRLVEAGWQPPDKTLRNMQGNVAHRANRGRAICEGCDKVPDGMVICCAACFERTHGRLHFKKSDFKFAAKAELALASILGRRAEAIDDGIKVVTREWRGRIYVTDIKEVPHD